MKCPSSGVFGVSDLAWLRMRGQDQVKFVVSNEQDLEFVRDTLRSKTILSQVLVSPVIGRKVKEANSWIQCVAEFCKEQNVRFSLQVHKLVWGNKKGV